MNTIKLKAILTLFLGLAMIAMSCNKEGKEKKISGHNDTESHNMGRNCMECHVKGQEGEGWFVIAGTVYDSLQVDARSNGDILISSGPNATGDLKLTIEVDGRGNFYSTEAFDFGDGLYVSALSSAGVARYMSIKVTTGACNSCHGVTIGHIWVD